MKTQLTKNAKQGTLKNPQGFENASSSTVGFKSCGFHHNKHNNQLFNYSTI
jgi:hypothetical protein